MKSKKDVFWKNKKGKKKVHFATLMDICHLKNAELEPKHQKYEGRVVLPRDIVKDDSGAYAVFTKQGSSASQVTGCTNDGRYCETTWLCGTRRRRSICLHPGKNGGRSRFATDSTVRGVQNLGQASKTQWFFLDEICSDTRLLWERHFEEVLLGLGGEEEPNWKCLFVLWKQRIFYSLFVDDMKFDWKKAEYGSHVEEIETCGSRRTNIISWSRLFGIYSSWAQNEREYYWTKKRNVWITNLLPQLKSHQDGRNLTQRRSHVPTTWKDMRKSTKKETVNWQKKVSTLVSRRRNRNQLDNCQNYAHNLSWDACIWHERKQTFSSSHQMDESLWQTLGSFEFLHSWHTLIANNMVTRCDTVQHCRLGLFQDSDVCWRPWRKINERANHICFGHSSIRSYKLDMQEANVSVSRFQRVRRFFSWCWFAKRMESVPLICGMWWQKCYVRWTTRNHPGSFWKWEVIQGSSGRLLVHVKHKVEKR